MPRLLSNKEPTKQRSDKPIIHNQQKETSVINKEELSSDPIVRDYQMRQFSVSIGNTLCNLDNER